MQPSKKLPEQLLRSFAYLLFISRKQLRQLFALLRNDSRPDITAPARILLHPFLLLSVTALTQLLQFQQAHSAEVQPPETQTVPGSFLR